MVTSYRTQNYLNQVLAMGFSKCTDVAADFRSKPLAINIDAECAVQKCLQTRKIDQVKLDVSANTLRQPVKFRIQPSYMNCAYFFCCDFA